ncbi:unnamed protein product [Adineta ricciae]|uniref:Major facilitator superfamily (MFS) profile domain-containing protein n=1 Tax=Adineta ricciae TaxID=249248 RepID=A0A813WV34_ADIRI|nr:unnamed protein product [Adineta ricciae]CAF1217635.1 unnamed protein product [Adineta ricciae]
MTNDSLELDPLTLLKASDTPTVIDDKSFISIYDVRSNRRRLFILIMIAFSSLILPFCDTVYLPALAQLEHDLKTSTTLVDYTISSYLVTCGSFGLLWGPLSDRFGRKIILLISFAFFTAFTIVCTLARSITVLLIFRSLQGGAISASLIVGQSVVVDMYPPERLGFAMGLFLVPLLVGPIIGPFIGGALASSFGWRSTFVALIIMAAISTIVILVFVPETHHYFITQRQLKSGKKIETKTIREIHSISKPTFMPPWRPFVFLLDITITPHIFVCATIFGTLFISLTLIANRAADKPYSLSPFLIGLCYIPTGTSSLLGSLCGGYVSDWSAKRFSRIPEGRLVISLLGSTLCPMGLLLCGWTFHFNVHIVVPLIGASMFCFGETFIFTSVAAFVNIKKSTMAGAILALINALSFVCAGLGIIGAIPLVAVIKFGPLFSLLAGLSFFTIIIAMVVVANQFRKTTFIIRASDLPKAESFSIKNRQIIEESTALQWF